MQTRTVKILLFRWVDEDGLDRYARVGQTVELSDEDAARGDENGAFVTEEPEAAEAGIGPSSTDEDLAAFAKTANVKDVVAAAGGDAEFAQRLLAAENDATGNDPRKGVAEGLAAVVGEA